MYVNRSVLNYIAHNGDDEYTVTLLDGGTYLDDASEVKVTAAKKDSERFTVVMEDSPQRNRIVAEIVNFLACVGDKIGGHGVPIESISGDIDLHAYDDAGRHVGMDYSTGEYEIEIGDARASGNILGS